MIITIEYLERASVGITQLTHNPEIVIKLDECRLCKLHEKHIDLLQKEVTMLRDELKSQLMFPKGGEQDEI